MRVQLALNVKNLEEAIVFYSKLFNVEVNKRKPGYANFSVEQPPLKLVLFENPNADERLNHLGVEVFDDADVRDATDRLKAADLVDSVEDEQTCCYATQNKVWAIDPQGMRWEYYRIIEDAENFGSGGEFEESTETPTPTPLTCCG
jgi:catechol 2,3-dioxygenase-like lactoylglutathione lyase family enzyme